MGGRFLWLIHQARKALSGMMEKPYFGGGALAKALEMSAPNIKRFSAAETE
jgi:hypothetical protein